MDVLLVLFHLKVQGLKRDVLASVLVEIDLYSAIETWSQTFNQDTISVSHSESIHVIISVFASFQFFTTLTYFFQFYSEIAEVFTNGIFSLDSTIISTFADIHESTFLSKFESSKTNLTS